MRSRPLTLCAAVFALRVDPVAAPALHSGLLARLLIVNVRRLVVAEGPRSLCRSGNVIAQLRPQLLERLFRLPEHSFVDGRRHVTV